MIDGEAVKGHNTGETEVRETKVNLFFKLGGGWGASRAKRSFYEPGVTRALDAAAAVRVEDKNLISTQFKT